MLITSEIIEQFFIWQQELAVSHPDSQLRHAAEARIMFKLRDGQQTLWLRTLTTGNESQYEAVASLDKLRQLAARQTLFEVLAIPTGLHPVEANQTESNQVFWLGDGDAYGAEDGLLLSILLPRSAAAPPTLPELLIEAEEHNHSLSYAEAVASCEKLGIEELIPYLKRD